MDAVERLEAIQSITTYLRPAPADDFATIASEWTTSKLLKVPITKMWVLRVGGFYLYHHESRSYVESMASTINAARNRTGG